jgi:hypothetical protein
LSKSRQQTWERKKKNCGSWKKTTKNLFFFLVKKKPKMANPDLVSVFHQKIVDLQDQVQSIVQEFKTATKDVTLDDVYKELKYLERNISRSNVESNTWLVNQMDDQACLIVFSIIVFVSIAVYFLCLFLSQTMKRSRYMPEQHVQFVPVHATA